MLSRCARALLCAVLVAALTGTFAASASAEDTACALGDQPVSRLSEFGAQFVTICLLNQERAANGLEPLTFNRELALAGDAYAAQMVSGHFFSHTGPGGDAPADRIQAQGYAKPDESWQVGETLAWGNLVMGTPRAIVRGWMASPAHAAVILDPALREVGIGIRLGAPISPTPAGESATYAASFGVRHPAGDAAYAQRVAIDPVPFVRQRRSAACRKATRAVRARSAAKRRAAKRLAAKCTTRAALRR